MRYIVKLNCHDWPHRGDMSKREVSLDAADDVEAASLAMLQAQQNWPGAKLKIFDIVKDRIAVYEAQQEIMQAQAAQVAALDELMQIGDKAAIRDPVPHEIFKDPKASIKKLGLRPA